MSTTTSIIILNAVLMFGIAVAIVSLCAGAIITSPAQERRHRLGRRRTVQAVRAQRTATAGTLVRRPSYES